MYLTSERNDWEKIHVQFYFFVSMYVHPNIIKELIKINPDQSSK